MNSPVRLLVVKMLCFSHVVGLEVCHNISAPCMWRRGGGGFLVYQHPLFGSATLRKDAGSSESFLGPLPTWKTRDIRNAPCVWWSGSDPCSAEAEPPVCKTSRRLYLVRSASLCVSWHPAFPSLLSYAHGVLWLHCCCISTCVMAATEWYSPSFSSVFAVRMCVLNWNGFERLTIGVRFTKHWYPVELHW